MNLTKIMLKVCYGGILIYISSDNGLNYEDLLSTAIDRFDIPINDNSHLQLCDADGYIFDKESLEYFLRLFPTTERILYIKINYTLHTSATANRNHRTSINERKQFASSKCPGSNKRRYAAPLRRQNCFIGIYPQEKPQRKLFKRHRINRVNNFKIIRV